MELDANKLTGDLTFDGGAGKIRDAYRTGDWMQTYSGRRYYPADPRPGDIDMASLAQSLATKNRYNGHCLPYSVAEHSVLISKLVTPKYPRTLERFGGKALVMCQRYGLVHDTPEMILTDIVRPVKRVLGKSNDIFTLEEMSWKRAFAPFFGLEPEIPQEVIELDVAICALERHVLHQRADDWNIAFDMPEAVIQCLDWRAAATAFLERYAELYDVAYSPLYEQWAALVTADMQRLHEHVFNAPLHTVRA